MPFLTEEARQVARASLQLDNQAPGRAGAMVGTIRAALIAELDREARLFPWHTYGDDQKSIAANSSADIPFRVDPAAYFVATELTFRTNATANNNTIQVIQDGDKQLFRSAVSLAALVTAAEGSRGTWKLPREWIFRPGATGVIRLATRTAATALIDAYVSGYLVRIG